MTRDEWAGMTVTGGRSLREVAEYALEQAAGRVAPQRAKHRRARVDYKALCALPQWKAETSFGITSYILPLPPSANTYWRNVKGRTLVSREARDYKKEVGLLAKRLGMRVLTGDVRLTIHVGFPTRRGDLSNRIKVLEDALIGVGYEDDKQIVAINAMKILAPGNPHVVVILAGEAVKE